MPRRGAFSSKVGVLGVNGHSLEVYGAVPAGHDLEARARAEAKHEALKELKSLQEGKVANPAQAYSDERNEFRFQHGIDESGFPEEGEPLHYVRETKLALQAAPDYEVVHDRVPVRKLPDTGARVLDVLEKGQVLKVFEWDATRTWRAVHVKLRGGVGGMVEAWVMIWHHELGLLLKPFCDEDRTLRKHFQERELGQGAVVQRAAEEEQRAAAGSQFDAIMNLNSWLLLSHEELRYCIEEMGLAEHQPGESVTASDGTQFVPAGIILRRLARGSSRYEVVRKPVVVARSRPEASAKMLGAVEAGSLVDTYGTDSSGDWVRVFGQFGTTPYFATAWMLKAHATFGMLLSPVD